MTLRLSHSLVKPNEHAPSDIRLGRPETWDGRNALPAIMVDCVFHRPVVVLIKSWLRAKEPSDVFVLPQRVRKT